MPNLAQICSDLEEEHRSLDDLLSSLEPAAWGTPTPAPGWSVRDQVSHLAFFDEAGAKAMSDPEGFAADLTEAAADIEGFMTAPLVKGRAMAPEDVLAWWRTARSAMLEVFGASDPDVRVAWYGPAMKPASFISARLMETWAHGQDVVDGLGVTREPTARLKHICFLGFRARPFSYVAHGLPTPGGSVRVELTAPNGELWSWGEGEDVVSGTALDFCLVVTQRRHPDDTDLETSGNLAAEWISIAQCFAGPPGEGRQPGQFPKAPR